jgi:hypothetical protein
VLSDTVASMFDIHATERLRNNLVNPNSLSFLIKCYLFPWLQNNYAAH